RSRWIMGAWSEPESLSINSSEYSVAHPALSPDGKTLYFASDRPGGQGASDLWMVPIRQDGSLGTPQNLGSEINTPARETFPFVTSENLLYFSSDGHPGLGGLDVFAAELPNLSHGGKILNVGRPVNSPQDDFTFILSDETHKGYFASNRPGGKGNDDIYEVLEHRPLSFNCEQRITGTVRDKIKNEVLTGATVRIINEDNIEIGTAITDTKGQYTITRDCNQGSFVRASREGYIATEEYLRASSGKPRIIDFYLEPETVYGGYGDDLAKLFQLSTIYFDFDRWEIRPDAEIEIMKIVTAMEKYPSLKVVVNSHTDSRGPDAYNLWLSQQRAESTVQYMISQGIAPDRLIGRGYGETQLINACSNGKACSDQEHALNRRSEFIIQE
ncbi:OmpA family protein, partial [Robiginitalea sp.]|nr:OmpA family protein [Robiginitalea sp.]